MSDKQIRWGVILSYVSVFLSTIISLTYTPFMVRTLGQSEYGLYQTAASMISMLSLLSLGLGSSYVRFYIREKSTGTSDDVARLNGMFFVVFGVLAVIALSCGFFLSNHLEWVFSDGLTIEEFQKAKILMRLLTVSLAVTFITNIFSSIITANERFVFQKILILIQQVAGPLLNIPLLLMGCSSVGIVVASVVVTAGISIANVVFCFKVLKVRLMFSKLKWQLFRDVMVFTVFIAINLIVDQINWSIDKILLGRYCGTIAVSVYAIGSTINTIYLSLSTSISSAFTPRVHQIWNDVERTESQKNSSLSQLFAMVGRLQLLVLMLVCSGFAVFGRQFIALWVGPGYESAYCVALCLMVPVTIPLSQNVGIEIQRAKNKHQFRAYLYLGMAFINLLLSIVLCQKYGEVGCAFATAISLLASNVVAINIYYQTVLKIDIISYWKIFARMCLVLLIPIASGTVLCYMLEINTWFNLLIGIVIYTCIYGISMLLLELKREERVYCWNLIKSKMNIR